MPTPLSIALCLPLTLNRSTYILMAYARSTYAYAMAYARSTVAYTLLTQNTKDMKWTWYRK